MAIYNKNKKSYQRLQPVVKRLKRRRRHAFTVTYNLSEASNPLVLVKYYRPKQAPNLPCGQNLPVSILTRGKSH